MKKLTSVKLQTMISMNNLDTELWCPILRFGRGARSEFRFPIVFKNYKQAAKLHGLLFKLIGEPIEKVREKSDKLFIKFKRYHYN